MTRDFTAVRNSLIFLTCALVAVMFGYLLATPLEVTSYAPLGLLLTLLCFPLLMRWHHPLVIICWNASILVFFLPGQPNLATVLACISLGVSLLDRTMGKLRFLRVPETGWPLLLIGIVVLVTAAVTGGVGGRAFGSEMWGAKRYLGVFGAIIGYFAITARPIAPERVKFLAAAFFLSGVTAIGSDLAYAAGPSFYFLFGTFSTEVAMMQATSKESLMRFTGVAWCALSLFYFMLMRYGIRGLLDFTRPWRLIIFVAVAIGGLFGGYRSSILLMVIIFAIQFYVEGLLRTRIFPMVLLAALLVGSLTIPFVNKLPLAVQRSLSFLPLDVDPSAKSDAQGTLDWRLTIWKVVLPEVPQYLFVGKGYTFNGTDYNLTVEAMRRGMFTAIEGTLVSGNYHNGFLTLIIPFGIVGTLGFALFCWGGVRTLYRNYHYGNPEYDNINRFLFVYFVGRLVFYSVFYGQFDLDLNVFTGTVAFSIALNRGVARRIQRPARQESDLPAQELEPALAAEAS